MTTPSQRSSYAYLSHRFARAACLVAVLVVVAGCGGRWGADAPVLDGYADLRQAGLTTHTLSLHGTWRAWDGPDNPIVAAYDYNDTRWRPVDIAQPFTAQGFAREGAVWYRAHLRLPERSANEPPFVGFVHHADNAHAVYVATPGMPPRVLVTSGTPSASPERAVLSRRPAYFELPRDTTLVLTWHVASHDYLSAGPFSPPVVAARPVMMRWLMQRFGIAFGLGALYLLLTGLCVLLWAFQRSDVRWLALGHLTAWMGIRSLAIIGVPDLLFPALVDFRVRIILEIAPLFGLLAAAPLLLAALFPTAFSAEITRRFGLRPSAALLRLEQQMGAGGDAMASPSPWARSANAWVLIVSVFVGLASAAATFALSPEFIAYLLRFGEGMLVLVLIWAVSLSVFAVRHRYPMARGLLAGFVLLALAGTHDVLRALSLVVGDYTGQYAFLVFVGILLFSIARRNAQYANYARRTAHDLEVEVQLRTREFRAATIAAQAANLTKSRFLAAVSHDLRTPLATLLGYLDVLDAELRDGLSATHREFFDHTVQSAQRLRERVNDMLDLTHLDAGDVTMQLRPLSAAALARRAAEAVRDQARAKGLTLTTEMLPEPGDALLPLGDTPSGTPPLYVSADAARLHQALRHILENAIKFTEAGAVTVRVSTVSLHQAAQDARAEAVATAPPLPASVIRFEIIDTGIGIAPEFRPRLFEHFAQDAHDFARSQRGTGIGLTLAARIVEHMRGRIAVVTARGEGTTVRVDLLRALPPA